MDGWIMAALSSQSFLKYTFCLISAFSPNIRLPPSNHVFKVFSGSANCQKCQETITPKNFQASDQSGMSKTAHFSFLYLSS